MRKWVKIPKPGQFRGEGEWEEFKAPPNNRNEDGSVMDEEQQFKIAGYLLPVTLSEEKPE